MGVLAINTTVVMTPVINKDRTTWTNRMRPSGPRAGYPRMTAHLNVVTPTPKIANHNIARPTEKGKTESNGPNAYPTPNSITQNR